MHDAVFGGYPSNTGCPSPHHRQLTLGNTCAFVEGFANFYSVATLGASTGELAATENNPWFPFSSGNGRFNEGTVSAFLLDLVDPANEAHDQIQLPAQYIGQVIQTCDVRFGPNGWQHGIDIGWDVWCFERAVDPAHIPDLPYVTAFRESASEPAAWNRDKIRAVWMWNFLNQVYTPPPPPPPGPPPSISVSLDGYALVRPSHTCVWYANANGGNSSNYTYMWAVNGVVIEGETTSSLGHVSPSGNGSEFTVEVVVADGESIAGSQMQSVFVSTQAGECYIY